MKNIFAQNFFVQIISKDLYPQANGAKRRSQRKPGARATNSVLAKFKVAVHGSWVLVCHDVNLTEHSTMANYRVE